MKNICRLYYNLIIYLLSFPYTQETLQQHIRQQQLSSPFHRPLFLLFCYHFPYIFLLFFSQYHFPSSVCIWFSPMSMHIGHDLIHQTHGNCDPNHLGKLVSIRIIFYKNIESNLIVDIWRFYWRVLKLTFFLKRFTFLNRNCDCFDKFFEFQSHGPWLWDYNFLVFTYWSVNQLVSELMLWQIVNYLSVEFIRTLYDANSN